jgi:hypothetical protein
VTQILYGQRGQPVGSIEDDAIFLRDGNHIAELIDGYLYKTEDGSWFGSVLGGVLFNVHGAPQAFTADCAEVILPPMPPALKSSLPVRVRRLGKDVTALASRRPPKFLLNWLETTGPTTSRDGYFA